MAYVRGSLGASSKYFSAMSASRCQGGLVWADTQDGKGRSQNRVVRFCHFLVLGCRERRFAFVAGRSPPSPFSSWPASRSAPSLIWMTTWPASRCCELLVLRGLLSLNPGLPLSARSPVCFISVSNCPHSALARSLMTVIGREYQVRSRMPYRPLQPLLCCLAPADGHRQKPLLYGLGSLTKKGYPGGRSRR